VSLIDNLSPSTPSKSTCDPSLCHALARQSVDNGKANGSEHVSELWEHHYPLCGAAPRLGQSGQRPELWLMNIFRQVH